MDDERKWGFALLLACPACIGGLFLGLGAAVGLTAAMVKGFAALGLLAVLAGAWARNAWLRRHEDDACPLPQASGSAAKRTPRDLHSGPGRAP